MAALRIGDGRGRVTANGSGYVVCASLLTCPRRRRRRPGHSGGARSRSADGVEPPHTCR